MLETKEQSLVAQRIVNGEIWKEVGILRMVLRKEILSDVKQSWRFVKAVNAENKDRQTAGEKHWEKWKRWNEMQSCK